jgi:hypothetical protein
VFNANSDGYPDLYISNFNALNQLLLGQQDGTFTQVTDSVAVLTVECSIHTAVLDCNKDGHDDLFVSNSNRGSGGVGCVSNNQLFLGSADGSFTAVTEGVLITANNLHSVYTAVLDADGDGWPDLYEVNSANQPNRLFLNPGDGTALYVKVVGDDSVAAKPRSTYDFHAAVLDANGDGHPDLLVAAVTAANRMFLNRGDGSFTAVMAGAVVSGGGKSRHTAVLDSNADGMLDVYVSNQNPTGGQGNQLFVQSRCNPGYKRPGSWSANICVACPSFSVAHTHGPADGCNHCAAGRIGHPSMVPLIPAEDFLCMVCIAGRYRDETAASSECDACPAGQYTYSGASACKICDTGRIPDGQAAS